MTATAIVSYFTVKTKYLLTLDIDVVKLKG